MRLIDSQFYRRERATLLIVGLVALLLAGGLALLFYFLS
jgi:hypothetical protein